MNLFYQKHSFQKYNINTLDLIQIFEQKKNFKQWHSNKSFVPILQEWIWRFQKWHGFMKGISLRFFCFFFMKKWHSSRKIAYCENFWTCFKMALLRGWHFSGWHKARPYCIARNNDSKIQPIQGIYQWLTYNN